MASETFSRIYNEFAKGKEMDGRTFVKVCKDSKLIGKTLTVTDCDLIFTQCKGKGAKRLTSEQFENALSKVAAKKKMSLSEIAEHLTECKGPVYEGTETEAVRFYDDKSTFTGVHAHGGPSTIDTAHSKNRATFSQLDPNEPTGATSISLQSICDRSTPDIRGLNKNFANAKR